MIDMKDNKDNKFDFKLHDYVNIKFLEQIYNIVKISLIELMSIMITLSGMLLSPIKQLVDYMTFPLMMRYLSIIFFISKFMTLPGLSIIVGSDVSIFFMGISDVYSGCYHEIKSIVTSFRQDIKDWTGVYHKNFDLIKKSDIDSALINELINDNRLTSDRKDLEISSLNIELNKRQLIIGEISAKNQLLSKDGSYYKYASLGVNILWLVHNLTKVDSGYSTSDRAMLATLVENVIRGNTRSSTDVFTRSQLPDDLGHFE